MYLEVILALPIEKSFYYYSKVNILKYSYVKVPFGKLICVGLVIDANSSCPVSNLKEIQETLNIPVASNCFITFLKWVAKYNFSTVGIILKLALSGITESEHYYSANLITKSKLTPSYNKVINLLQEEKILSEFKIRKETNVSRRTLKKMANAHIIKLSYRPISQNSKVKFDIILSDKQKEVYKIITQHLQRQVILLDGITGSGKTEVYLSIIADILTKDSNAQTLILLPEIILASQIEERFNKYFKSVDIIKWHSSLSKRERENSWWKIVNGQAQIIIGARSALFLPYKNLKMIVVDEEHDSSFKQATGKTNYNARDMAIVRAAKEKIPIILSSATPSLESFYNATSGKFKHVFLSVRHSRVELPLIKVVDMRKEKRWISRELCESIKETIYKNKQVLLFLNRRGYSPLTVCNQCGYKPKCKNCSAWLVQHKRYQAFLCHFCGYKLNLFNDCPDCYAENSLIPSGVGVERIEEEVKSLLPNANVLTVSSDMVTNVSKSKELFDKVIKGKINIIIGTQLITKGYHFPKLDFVGVIDADISLYGGNLRSAERTYQLLQQVSGRAGRESTRGTVLLQSYNPSEISKRYLCDKKEFYSYELQSRKQNNMPPFTRITTIIVNNVNNNKAISISNNIAKQLLCEKLRILGPVPANTHLVKKNYIYKIAIISPKVFDIQSYIKNCALIARYNKAINIDIDSVNLF